MIKELIQTIETLQKEARDGMKRASGDSDPYLYQYMVGKFHAFGKVAWILKKLPSKKEQKPAEWSEEDEDMLNSCTSSIEEAKENRYAYKETDGDTSYDHEIAWLKSLRPVSKESLQPHWKPSEEQMKWLKDVIETVPMTCRQQGPLESLYADLQKLL